MAHPAEEALILYFRQLRDEMEAHGDHVSGLLMMHVEAMCPAHTGDLKIEFKVYNGDTWSEASTLRAAVDEGLRRLDFKKRNAPICLPRVGERRSTPHDADEIAF